MRLTGSIAAALLLAASATPAAAQQQPRKLDVPARAEWKHAQSGLTLPASLAGLSRGDIRANGSGELDVSVQYGDTRDSWVTLFVFRPAGGTLPIWYDRAETQIVRRPEYRGLQPLSSALPFAPPGSAVTSGLRRSFRLQGAMKATGLALIPLGEWVVAVRATSVTLDAPALDARLSAILAAIGWPQGGAAAPATVPVAACADALAYAKNAKPKAPETGDAMAGALVASPLGLDQGKRGERPPTWCRDGDGTLEYGVYRNPALERDSYLLALGDAGNLLRVWPGVPIEGRAKSYLVSLSLLDRGFAFPGFDNLPHPQQAIEAMRKSRPIAAVTLKDKNVELTLDPSSLK